MHFQFVKDNQPLCSIHPISIGLRGANILSSYLCKVTGIDFQVSPDITLKNQIIFKHSDQYGLNGFKYTTCIDNTYKQLISKPPMSKPLSMLYMIFSKD